jgi:DUF4097 and DUF4098 domain-containing protein YvlB
MLRRLAPAALVIALATPALAQARADFRWEKALSAGNEVSIHNINGDVTVIPSTSGKVEVVGVKRGSGDLERIRADVQLTSRGVVICVLDNNQDSYCDERGMHSNSRNNDRNYRGDREWNNVSMNLEVAVPTNVQVSANSVSGDVSITGATGDVRANSVSGDLRLDRLRASSVSATTVSGNVDVSIQEFTGRGDLVFHTVSGDVTLDLPRQLDVDLSMTTVSGGINSDYALTLGNGRVNRRNIEARIGSGGRRLDLTTVSGDVKLRANR